MDPKLKALLEKRRAAADDEEGSGGGGGARGSAIPSEPNKVGVH
jgi:hypothetical protein